MGMEGEGGGHESIGRKLPHLYHRGLVRIWECGRGGYESVGRELPPFLAGIQLEIFT